MLRAIYRPYWEWECYQQGLYAPIQHDKIDECIVFMQDVRAFGLAMLDVVDLWENSMMNHLTQGRNHRSFIGQCAALLAIGASGATTRKAWSTLSPQDQGMANMAADKAYKKWKQGNAQKIILASGSEDATQTDFLM